MSLSSLAPVTRRPDCNRAYVLGF